MGIINVSLLACVNNVPILACDKEIYTEPGTIMYPKSGNYEPNMNCYFKIKSADGTKVKITFTKFSFQAGVDYRIELYSNNPIPPATAPAMGKIM